MTPLNPQAPRSGNPSFVTGLGLGLAIGLAFSCLGGAAGYSFISRQARKGWNLMPVVVAAVDIQKGTPLTFDLISQRSMPEQFVTSSFIRPDRASAVVNQKALVALQAGDPLLWSQFETPK